jgi:phosphoglucomutase
MPPSPLSAWPLVLPGTAAVRLSLSFNEWHVLAISQAICLYRRGARASMARCLSASTPTHCPRLPAPAPWKCWPPTVSHVMLAADDEYTPTPAISHAILCYNRGRTSGLADGVVITPSHNPPQKAAATSTTRPMVARPTPTSPNGSRPRPTNCWPTSCAGVKRMGHAQALKADTTHRHDYLNTYVADLVKRHRHGRHPQRRSAPGCGPAGWCRGALLVGHRRALPS